MADDLGSGPGRARQNSIYLDGLLGRHPRVPTGWPELERRARRRMSRRAFAYVAGSAGGERTAAANRSAFGHYRLVPRMLRDVSHRDIGTELFGRRIPAPVLLAPVGALGIVHRDADIAVARAAAELGVPYIFSNQASRSMEDCAAVMGNSPRWFQLYYSTDQDLVGSLLDRASRSGCEAITVTLDTTMLGWRPRDLDLGSLPFARGEGIAQYTSDPVFAVMATAEPAAERPRPSPREVPAALATVYAQARRYPGRLRANLRSPLPRAAVQKFLRVYSRPSLSWPDLARLRDLTRLPIVLKGIQRAEDARRAVGEGMDGIIVSTHGGRQVDGGRAALDSLPGVVDAVNGAVPVLLDSGIRGGADILIALALGAKAVCIGRPYVYGLAIGGAAGVRDVVANLVAEFDLTLGLCGYTNLAGLDRSVFEV